MPPRLYQGNGVATTFAAPGANTLASTRVTRLTAAAGRCSTPSCKVCPRAKRMERTTVNSPDLPPATKRKVNRTRALHPAGSAQIR